MEAATVTIFGRLSDINQPCGVGAFGGLASHLGGHKSKTRLRAVSPIASAAAVLVEHTTSYLPLTLCSCPPPTPLRARGKEGEMVKGHSVWGGPLKQEKEGTAHPRQAPKALP